MAKICKINDACSCVLSVTILMGVCLQGERQRITVCVSSQIGCAMNCQFCFTGTMGLK